MHSTPAGSLADSSRANCDSRIPGFTSGWRRYGYVTVPSAGKLMIGYSVFMGAKVLKMRQKKEIIAINKMITKVFS
jgi:hypothetical protein